MRTEDFASYLDYCGIRFKESAKAFILQDCPECGSDGYKTYLYKDEGKGYNHYYGKCHKCDEKFTSYTYLILMGQDKDEVKKLHNITNVAPEDFDKLDLLGEASRSKTPNEVTNEITIHSIQHLTFINLWEEHPAARYAISRGVTPDLFDRVMIDHKAVAVAFLCVENGIVVGYQYRYLNPENPDMKTWNPPSFKKANHIIEYANKGDIAVCEGPFTAISAYHYGFHAVCTFGAGVSVRQIDLIKKLAKESNKRVFVAYDKDAAGLGGFFKIKHSLKMEGIEVERIVPEHGNDLNDSWKVGKKYICLGNEDEVDYTIPVLKLKPFKEGYEL